VGQFVGNPLIRNIVGQQKTSIDLRDAMDSKKILIVNLSKGKVGEGNANLIGSLLITKIYLAAMSRADVGPYELEKLPPFYLYVDEFQNFANESFANILSEARKYNLALTVAHQYVEQMTDEVKAAVFGNVGTMIAFRVGATDAEIFEKEFAPYFILDDIVNLSAYQIYLRLMIDGVGSKPFSAHTLDPIPRPLHSYADAVIASSRMKYGKPIKEVEDEVAEFYKPMAKPEVPKREAPKVEERSVHVREIKKDTPLPKHAQERQNERGGERQGERRHDLPDRRAGDRRQGERRSDGRNEGRSEPRREPAREERAPEMPQTFDDRPALSLKDALARAMEGKSDMPKPKEEKKIFEDPLYKEAKETFKGVKEIPEETLKKLIGEDE
jgi:hypothetical protein